RLRSKRGARRSIQGTHSCGVSIVENWRWLIPGCESRYLHSRNYLGPARAIGKETVHPRHTLGPVCAKAACYRSGITDTAAVDPTRVHLSTSASRCWLISSPRPRTAPHEG